MTSSPDRTAPFQGIRSTPISDFTDQTAQTITHTVCIPGLTTRTGGPLTVDRTYTLDEVDADWVSAIVDYDFGSAPVAYGNHPHAVGPLREILPDAYPLPAFPTNRRTARDKIVRVQATHNLGGWVTIPVDSDVLEYRFPDCRNGLGETPEKLRQRYFALLREYLPFQADIWLDDARDMIVISPVRATKKEARIVRFTA